MLPSSLTLPRARVLAVALVAAVLPFAAPTTPASAIDGVGGGSTTSARDQYDSGPDAQPTPAPAPADGGGQAPATAAGAGTTGAAPTGTRSPSTTRRPGKTSKGSKGDGRSGKGDDDGNGVLGDGAGGATDPDGGGVLGDGADGSRGNGSVDPAQAQRQQGLDGGLPFTGWSLAPVALLGLGLLAAGVTLRRRTRTG